MVTRHLKATPTHSAAANANSQEFRLYAMAEVARKNPFERYGDASARYTKTSPCPMRMLQPQSSAGLLAYHAAYLSGSAAIRPIITDKPPAGSACRCEISSSMRP